MIQFLIFFVRLGLILIPNRLKYVYSLPLVWITICSYRTLQSEFEENRL